MPGGDRPGTDPGIGALEAAVRDSLNHAGGAAEALRMNVMSTLSKGVHAADTDRRFEAARLAAVGAAGPVRFARAYEAARNSTTNEMFGRFYEGTVRAVTGALWRVEEPAAGRAAVDAFEVSAIEGGLPDSLSGPRREMYDAYRDAVRVEGWWVARLGEGVVDAAAESISEMGANIISMSARTARTGTALCAATAAMLDSSGSGSLEVALDGARRAVPEYASAVINDEAGFVVSTLLEEVRGRTRRRRGAGAWEEMARVARKRAAVQAAVIMAADVFEAVYGATIRGVYRTTARRALFESSYPEVLRKVAAEEAAGPRPNRATMYGFADVGRIDYRAAAGPSDDSGLVGLYEATYQAAYAAALKGARQLSRDARRAAGEAAGRVPE